MSLDIKGKSWGCGNLSARSWRPREPRLLLMNEDTFSVIRLNQPESDLNLIKSAHPKAAATGKD